MFNAFILESYLENLFLRQLTLNIKINEICLLEFKDSFRHRDNQQR